MVFGDYFKKEQHGQLWEFLVEEVGLDPKRIYCSVFAGDKNAPKDEESIEVLTKLYKKYGIDVEEGSATLGEGDLGPGMEIEFNSNKRIFPYIDKCWWMRGDAIGELGGPSAEIFYKTKKPHDPKFGKHCHINCDCGQFLEIGNSVFMEFKRTKNGWVKLKQRNVDFGGGFERWLAVSQETDDAYKTDVFYPLIQRVEELSGLDYGDKEDWEYVKADKQCWVDTRKDFRVIADHIRASVFFSGRWYFTFKQGSRLCSSKINSSGCSSGKKIKD